LGETANRSGRPQRIPDPPAPIPQVLIGSSAESINTRCPDFGEVELELWAGDPGATPTGWGVAFDGALETVARGFDLGSMATLFHIDAAPGMYRVRAESHVGDRNYVDAVRFIFPDSPELAGRAFY
jgi:hypothetical protein